MEGDFIKINEWMLPLSWLYGLGVRLRNQLFELGILKSRSFDIPVISVGNITVGDSETGEVRYSGRLHRQYHRRRYRENTTYGISHPPAQRQGQGGRAESRIQAQEQGLRAG